MNFINEFRHKHQSVEYGREVWIKHPQNVEADLHLFMNFLADLIFFVQISDTTSQSAYDAINVNQIQQS